MKHPHHYIIVDDDPSNSFICEVVIESCDPTATISIYHDPETALLTILEKYSDTKPPVYTTLFLDIHMPGMNGWEFLEKFRNFATSLEDQFSIYVLSSSNEDFSKKAEEFPFVADFVQKPLTKEKMQELVGKRKRFITKNYL